VNRPFAVLAALAVLTAAPAAAAGLALRHDPFRPAAVRVQPPPPAAVPAAESPVAMGAAVWHAQLRAVLVDGARSLANVDGVMVPLGGEVDGFRLVGVDEGRAVFVRDGRRFELTLDGGGGRQ
jgi:hypothetical protein